MPAVREWVDCPADDLSLHALRDDDATPYRGILNSAKRLSVMLPLPKAKGPALLRAL